MNRHVVQINFSFRGTAEAYAEANLPYAEPIGQMPGLQVKVWLMNAAKSEAGGIYLFDDGASAQAFVAQPMVQALGADPNLANLSIKLFDVLEPHTAITSEAARSRVGA